MKLKKLSKTTSPNFTSIEMFVVCDTYCQCGCACRCVECLGHTSEINNPSSASVDSGGTNNTTSSGQATIHKWG